MPEIMTEDETLDYALAGGSLSRFGDGELRIACGGTAVSQSKSHALADELSAILRSETHALTCIPHNKYGPKRANWTKYHSTRFTRLYCAKRYGSAFITRPDSAPSIDRPDYWDKVRRLWRGRRVTLVVGDRRSLREEEIRDECDTLTVVESVTRDAYAEIDRVERNVIAVTPGDAIVLICLGATATCLAERLARRGLHAVDIGHIGMFMRRRRMFGHGLFSAEYQRQLEGVHAVGHWRSGHSHRGIVASWAKELGARTVLDYGCGKATLGRALAEDAPHLKYSPYDPGIANFALPPVPADLVVCTDVMEHVEEGSVHNVLDHLYQLTKIGAFVTISCSPSTVMLPDGRNSHVTIRRPEWWIDRLRAFDWELSRVVPRKGVWVWLRKSTTE